MSAAFDIWLHSEAFLKSLDRNVSRASIFSDELDDFLRNALFNTFYTFLVALIALFVDYFFRVCRVLRLLF